MFLLLLASAALVVRHTWSFGGATPGVVRTYTFVGKTFSLPNVARAAAQGRNFVTSGPLLLVTCEGQPPGSAFPADGKTRTLQIACAPKE